MNTPLLTPTPQKITLRPYQEALIGQVYNAWAQTPRVMAQMPTGSGKTIVFAAIADEFVKHGEQVLVLVHRTELLHQAVQKLGAIAGCPVGVIKSGYRPDYTAPVQVASVQTLVHRLSCLEAPGLIVVDESHHSTANSYRKVLAAYPNANVLGVTATPCRTDGSGFADQFGELVCGPTVSELIDAGHLAQFKLFADPDPMRTAGVRTRRGDYKVSDLEAANDAIALSGSLVGTYRQHCPGKRAIVFAVSVAHSKAIAAAYQAAGVPSQHLDGDSPAQERQQALDRFAAGDLLVLTNCGLFGEGLDVPTLDVVQVARPTKSLGLWLQMVGRALRPAPGKPHALIMDRTKNWAIHGLPTRPRVWTLDGVEQLPQRVRVDRTGEVTVAPPPPPAPFIDGAGALQQVAPDPMQEWRAVHEELWSVCAQRMYKPRWVYHQLVRLRPPLAVWQAYAQRRGYARGWAWYRWMENGQTTLP